MDDRKKLFAYLRGEMERKMDRKQAIRETLSAGVIPVSDDLRDAIARLFVTDAMEVLRAHPGFDLEDKIRSIRTALQLFDRAFADLMLALDEFDALSRRPEFSYRSGQNDVAMLDIKVRKEIFALSELAHTLQDHCRHARSRWNETAIVSQISACFRSDGLHDFVCGLRTALHHHLMVEANWQIRDSGPAQTSHYVFDRGELLAASKDWNLRARGYLAGGAEKVDVRAIAQAYYPRVHALYDWLLGEAEKDPPAEVYDYRRCWNAHRQRAARMTWRFFLTQFLNQKIDPYKYLERYLTPAEIEDANRLPQHSREQADFVIRIVDEHSACDDEIRELAYKLFGVTAV
jgi:hypothetical protein